MPVTKTFYAADRAEWRAWLAENHTTADEIWLLFPAKDTGRPGVSYLHAVEEAICFGWIDGIARRMNDEFRAQRFTPRRPRSNWTELNKERARRLIAAGLMTEAGHAVLPDLALKPLEIAPDILAALRADEETWRNFEAFPDLYQRIRIGYIEEARAQPDVFRSRLENFLKLTRQNKQLKILI
ncbi:hypothetical protein FBR02_05790 [Anaerolineae bacterium CFX9]|nr:hypothetical protein [Anaerolineae bacterium CFX9]